MNDMSPENPNRQYLLAEYRSRINRVIDYIEANIDQNLTLETLAGVANFSPFHFHRIFAAMMGETLSQYIQRIRVEKAANRLIGNPRDSVTEIALDCGFSGPSVFARAFRDSFGMSARQWRAEGYLQHSNMGQAHRKIKEEFIVTPYYTEGKVRTMKWRVTMKEKSNIKADIEVKDLPELHVAYIRHVGPYAGDTELFGRLFSQLFAWAGPRGLLNSPDLKVLCVYHDSPELTDDSKLRTSVCISVPEDTPVDGEIGKMTVQGGQYAVAHFEVTSPDQYADGWNAVGSWLPESGYQPADAPPYELYLNNPEEHPEKKHIVEICLPVKPL